MPTPEQIEEDAKLTAEERAEKLAEAKRAYEAVEPAPRSVLYTYPDGSQRVGTPPFPDLSPKQEAEAKLERVGAPAEQPVIQPATVPTSEAPAQSGTAAEPTPAEPSAEELEAIAASIQPTAEGDEEKKPAGKKKS